MASIWCGAGYDIIWSHLNNFSNGGSVFTLLRVDKHNRLVIRSVPSSTLSLCCSSMVVSLLSIAICLVLVSFQLLLLFALCWTLDPSLSGFMGWYTPVSSLSLLAFSFPFAVPLQFALRSWAFLGTLPPLRAGPLTFLHTHCNGCLLPTGSTMSLCPVLQWFGHVPLVANYEGDRLPFPSVFTASTQQCTPIIVDTGASTHVTPHRADFLLDSYGPSTAIIKDLSVQNRVAGEGLICWRVTDINGQ
eukprot:CCRYP_001894-RA/>CCRYP_001894-RA protein AED:0.81 eAED:0.41 QI:0/0/0/0.33/1/1/3/0/245